MTLYIVYGVPLVIIGYFVVIFIFDLLLRGFVPFITSRPWVVEQILSELEIKKENSRFLAFSSGRSGFFHALEKKYPASTLLGIEPSLFPFIVARVQLLIRRSRIKVIKEKIHRVDVGNFDLIYCHLTPKELHDMGEKFKFECRAGTKIISTGYNIPYLEPDKIIDLPDRKGRLDWLSKNQKLFQRKSKRYKKEKKAYFYVI